MVHQRREDQMNVIRHDDRNAQIKFLSVVMQAAFQNGGPYSLRKNPSTMSTKCYEVLPLVALQVRKLPAIESLRHRFGQIVWGPPRLSGGAKLRSAEV
jgi:hypothetical protein